MGPMVYAKHLVSGSRLPFTAAYFGSIAMTLFFAIGVSALLLSHESYPLPCSSALVYPVCPATAARPAIALHPCHDVLGVLEGVDNGSRIHPALR